MPVSGTSDAVYADELYTGRICPVPNSHAGAAIAVVLLYSAVFLFYAQYHFAIMLVMTRLVLHRECEIQYPPVAWKVAVQFTTHF